MMPRWFSPNPPAPNTLRAKLVVLVFCAIGTVAHPQANQGLAEQELAGQLAIAGQMDMPLGSRIALAPPPPNESALPMAQLEAIMGRVAQKMIQDWPSQPRILAGSSELRTSLAMVLGRQGQDAWRKTVDATLRQEADFVLVGETGIGAGAVTLRLSLIGLQDGRVLAKTSDVALDAPRAQAATTPRGGIAQAITQFQQSVPQSQAYVTIGAFVSERSGFETPLGRALSDMSIEAWFNSAGSLTAMLKEAPAPRIARGAEPDDGFYVSGLIRLIDADRFQLVLRLSEGGVLLASRTLDLTALQLAPHLRRSVTPNIGREMTGFEPLHHALSNSDVARLDLQALGGIEGRYPICRATDFSTVLSACRDSLIQLVVTTDQPGEVVCVSMDEFASFSLILPNAYADAPRLAAGQQLLLPDDLPPLPDGTKMYWPAQGPASQTLVACMLFSQNAAQLGRLLAQWDGRTLTAAEVFDLQAMVQDAAPLAANGLLVEVGP